YDHGSLDGLAPSEELRFGQDGNPPPTGFPTVAPALPLGLQAGGAADGLHLVLDQRGGLAVPDMHDGVGWVILADEGVLIAAVAAASATAAAPHRALSRFFRRTILGRMALGGLIGVGRVAVVLFAVWTLLTGAVFD